MQTNMPLNAFFPLVPTLGERETILQPPPLSLGNTLACTTHNYSAGKTKKSEKVALLSISLLSMIIVSDPRYIW